MDSKETKHVCVIGAGVSGICVLRHLSGCKNISVTAFERSYTFGGLWQYSDQTTTTDFGFQATSPVYKTMRTNVPKQLVAFGGIPMDDKLPAFPGQEDVMKYLEHVVMQCDLLKYMKFHTDVKEVRPSNSHNRYTKWKVTFSDIRHKNAPIYTEEFDNVIVCNGVNWSPRHPDIEGEKNFQGYLIHSIRFKHPEYYTGQTVAVLGASFGGLDIAVHLTGYAKKVYLCYITEKMNNTLPENLIEKNSGFKRITKSSVILQNGEELPVDAIIYSTGYKYSFPFLPEGMVRWDKHRLITHFYKDIIPVEYPSIMFMLMPRLISFYPVADQQARFIASIVSGVCQLPLEGEMKSIQAHEFKNRPIDGDSQWDYDRELAELGHFEPLPVVLKKIWDHHFKIWYTEFVKIRKMSYKITGTDSYTAMEQ